MGVIRIVSFFLASPALLSANSDFPTSFSQLVASDIGGLNGWERVRLTEEASFLARWHGGNRGIRWVFSSRI